MNKTALLLAPFVLVAASALAQPALPDRPIARAEVTAAVKARFAELDANRDGTVSLAEFDAYRARREAGDAGGAGAAAFVHVGRSFFARADADGDGRMTLAEASARPLRMFDMADADGDGVVSVRERQMAMMLMSLGK